MRAVQEREANILRRYKVTPITPAPLLVASTIVGWIIFMPFVVLMFALAHFGYGMPWPTNLGSIFCFVTLAIMGFRAIGMILAAVANSMQESQILVQLLYLPMLFLSGATFPSSIFPSWLLVLTQFLPATYLVSGLQGMMLRHETLAENGQAALALATTLAVGLFVSYKLFRWEKEEKIRASAKLWIGGVLLPFVLLGAWQVHTRQNVQKTRILARQMARSQTYLIRGARIFAGDGRVIESGAVLVRGGKIAQIYGGSWPQPEAVEAEPIEAAGKTVLPGLIDVHVHLGAPGGFYANMTDDQPDKVMLRHLAAYLYSGITAVKSVGDSQDVVLKIRSLVNSGEEQGAELFICGPLFTAAGGHGTEYFRQLPPPVRERAQQQFTRIPASANDARRQVDELKRAGVDGIKVVLEAGAGTALFNRLDGSVLQAIAQEAHAQGLPLAVHTGDVRDVADALSVGADSIEHGSFRQAIPDRWFEQMARQKTFYDPTLSAVEAIQDLAAGKADLLRRSLVEQVGPAEMLEETGRAISSPDFPAMRRRMPQIPADFDTSADNLLRAYQHGVPLVTGSDAGTTLVVHGPTVQREVELWVRVGIPAAVALAAATHNAAQLLHAENRIGSIRQGSDADLLLVDGNPLEDVTAIERISLVIFKGELVDRPGLFNQD
jgi:imidazolonepropionase-like amidohydrolase